MFRGEHPELGRVMGTALALAHDLEHTRAGSEHLLLALTMCGSTVAAVLAEHGATTTAVQRAVRLAEPAGAGAAADRDTLATLGIGFDHLSQPGAAALLDRPPQRQPRLPLGAARARRRCARMNPPLGLDAQASYEASLRLALARREREHRPEHLALTLLALDPGAAWALATANLDTQTLLTDLAKAFPPPQRNPLLRTQRRLGQPRRHHDIVRRYQHTTGRIATASPAIAALING